MIHGIDTGFLVSAEVAEHPGYTAARATLARLLAAGDRVALTPQVLAEFIHIVTDPRRFSQPIEMSEARRVARKWWTAREVDQVFPNSAAARQFLEWLEGLSLGRKRLLDTLLAATYRHAGIQSLLTTNAGDFAVLGCFDLIAPGGAIAKQ
jgi:predicted nucleic acid-binding protein